MTILVMAVIYPRMFHVSAGSYLPYLTTGFLAWFFILSIVTDGCNIYINAAPILREVRLPITFHAFHMTLKTLIIFAHNFVIYLIVMICFPRPLGWSFLLLIPALVVYAISGVALATIFGMLSARFRDVPPIIGSGMQVLFFLTPVFWDPSSMSSRPAIIDINPLYHYIEIVRAPLLGTVASAADWAVVLGCTLGLCVLAGVAIGRLRHRVVFWL